MVDGYIPTTFVLTTCLAVFAHRITHRHCSSRLWAGERLKCPFSSIDCVYATLDCFRPCGFTSHGVRMRVVKSTNIWKKCPVVLHSPLTSSKNPTREN